MYILIYVYYTFIHIFHYTKRLKIQKKGILNIPDLDAGALVSYMTLCCMCSFLNLLSYELSAIRLVLFLLIQSSARVLWLSLMSGVMLSGRCWCLSLSCSVLETEAGRLFPPRSAGLRPECCPGLPLIACAMLPFTKGTRLGGTPVVLRGFGLWRLSSGGSSGFENPFGTGIPLACRAD